MRNKHFYVGLYDARYDAQLAPVY